MDNPHATLYSFLRGMTKANVGCGCLLVILSAVAIVLKLTGVIEWPWSRVVSPVLVAIGMNLATGLISALVYARMAKRR